MICFVKNDTGQLSTRDKCLNHFKGNTGELKLKLENINTQG